VDASSPLSPIPDHATTVPVSNLNASSMRINFGGSTSGTSISLSSSTTTHRHDWASWNLWVGTAGQYNIDVDANAGGTLEILVDGVTVDSFDSQLASTRPPVGVTLSRGLHSVRVRNASTTA